MAEYHRPYVEESEDDGYSDAWTDSTEEQRLHSPGHTSQNKSPRASHLSANDRRRPARGDFAFTKVEQEGLSETLQMDAPHDNPSTAVYSLHGNVKHAAWNQPKTELTQDNATCELLNIYALQHALGGDEFDKITLTCLGGPSNEAWHSAPIQLRWLHVQRNGLTLELLKDLVLACPYVSRDLSAVTARLLGEIRFKYARTSDSGAYLEPGSIMRYICQHFDEDGETKHQKTEPVMFVSCPQLVMKEFIAASTERPSRHDYHPRTLLQTLYNYDTGENEMQQSVQKMTSSKSGQILHVNELWCLLIGSNVLITMSDLPAKTIQGRTVTIDERPSGKGGVLTIQLFENGRQHNTVIDAACTYADLAKHCVLLATGHPSHVLDYKILDSDYQTLTPYRWLELLSSGSTYDFQFYLERKKTLKRGYRGHTHRVQSDQGRRKGTDDHWFSEDQDYSSDVSETLDSDSQTNTIASSNQYRSTYWGSPRLQTDGLGHKEKRAQYIAIERQRTGKQRSGGNRVDHSSASEWRKTRLSSQTPGLGEENRSAARTSPKQYVADVGDKDIDIRIEETTDSVEVPDPGGSLVSGAGSIPPGEAPSVLQAEASPPTFIPPAITASTGDEGNHDGTQSRAMVLHRPRHYSDDSDSGTKSYSDTRFRGDPGPFSLDTQSGLDPVNSSQEGPSHSGPAHGRLDNEFRRFILQVEPRLTPPSATFSESAERIFVPWGSPELRRRLSQGAHSRPNATERRVVNDPDLKITSNGPKVYRLDFPPGKITSADAGFSRNVLEGSQDAALAERSGLVPSRSRVYERAEKIDRPRERAVPKSKLGVAARPRTLLPSQIPQSSSYTANKQDLERTPTKSSSPNMRWVGFEHDKGDQFDGSGETTPGKIRPGRSHLRYSEHINPGTTSASFAVESDIPGVACFPFLTWRLQGDPKLQDHVNDEERLSIIMNSVEQTLLRSELKVVYFKSYDCTFQQLELRHAQLVTPCEGRPFRSLQEVKKYGQGFPDLNGLGDVSATAPGNGITEKKLTGKTPSPLSESPGWKGVDYPVPPEQRRARPLLYDGHTMKRLLSVSQDLLSAFVPNSRIGSSHALCKRFWGALDDIFRQLNWESSGSDMYNHLFTIANFDGIKDTQPGSDVRVNGTWQHCQDCQSQKTYMSAAAALNHLHTHMACTCLPTSRPYEDPCYSWVECEPDYRLDEPESTTFVLEEVDRFIKTVSLIRDQVRQLHGVVANPSDKEARRRPPLATSLVNGLTEILKLYLLQAKVLTYINRVYHDNYLKAERDTYRSLLKGIQDQAEGLRTRTLRLLRDAKKDIVLLGTTGQGEMSLAIKSVGAEFLLIWLVSSTQNNLLIPTDLAPSTEGQDSSYIEIYRRYVSKLNYQASRRPKRKVFKDIYHCQEELAAVNTINKAQHTLLNRLVRLLDPASFRITSETRIGQFRAEKALARRQQHRLEARTKSIRDLVVKTAHLKDNVKQMMEIIDEKAVRVFTIVTLFFLPLSFVSSFMGMNTADIRGMEYGQTVFWATAVPVTVSVVAVALLYGYYGDEIGDWVHSHGWRGKRRKAFPKPIQGRRQVRKRQAVDSLGF